ncbi:MAG: TonB-dependent receptor, partial [Bacteroidota bacterium]
ENKQTFDGAQWPNVLQNYYRQKRNMIQKDQTSFVGVQATHDVSTDVTYKLSFGYYDHLASLTDPDFGDNWQLYMDSLANAQLGYTGFRRYYSGPLSWNTIYGFGFFDPNAPNNKYQKNHDRSYQASAEVRVAIAEGWSLGGGASYEQWSFRKYQIANIQAMMEELYSTTGRNPTTYSSPEARRIMLMLSGQSTMRTYGFDVDGHEVDSGPDEPRSPRFSSGFLESKLEDSAFTMRIGLEFERYDLRLPYLRGSTNDFPQIPNDDWPDESQNIVSEAKNVVLPRLSLSIKPSPMTSVSFAYGTYSQFAPLQDVFVTALDLYTYAFWNGVNLARRGAVQAQFLEPERISQFEGGLSTRREGLNADFRIYYKRLQNLTQLAINEGWWIYDNSGSGSAYGADVTLELRPNRKFALTLNYSLSDVHGTESNPRSNWVALTSADPADVYPSAFYPLDYSKYHQGSLLAELSFDEEDGRILDGLRLTSLFTFRSGHRYTHENFPTDLGQASAWTIGTYTISNPAYARTSESPNASTTPWTTNVDLHAEYLLTRLPVRITATFDMLNLLDTRQVINVYPATASATDDGWLSSNIMRGSGYPSIPNYVDAYRIFNLRNRWAYINATGYDVYNPPRQFRIGLAVEM